MNSNKIKSNNKIYKSEDYITLTKWNPLKSKEETNTDYRINEEKMKLERRRPMRKGRPR